MMDELSSNALKAEKKYQDQYVEITGILSNIDSDGKYIGLVPSDDEYAFIGVQCYIKSDEQTDRVMEMTIGDTVTIKGQITIIGEVLGYSLDIDEIK
jgi:aspartyl/asparaginyl-tRNA synthetase